MDLEKGFVDLRCAGLPGGKRHTHVPISQEALDEARAAREIARTPFMIECQSRRIGDISRAYRAAVKRAGLLDEVAPYCLRHTCVTWMAQIGSLLDLWEIDGFLGHGTLQNSPSYALPTLVDGATKGSRQPFMWKPHSMLRQARISCKGWEP